MTKLTRRAALASGLATGATACSTSPKLTPFEAKTSTDTQSPFSHGVASGDPAHHSIVLWTRVDISALDRPPADIQVVWELAADADFADMRAKGETTTNQQKDGTVKSIPTDLQAGTTYYYRFRIGDIYSSIGRTKTLPDGDIDKARFAVVSCSNYPFGYFNVYDLISRRENLNAVIHLGDYFYEYGPDGYGGETGKKLGREHQPAHEIVSLTDYRKRHAQYKSDPSTQAMHAAHPMIAIWDDHETTNNSWKNGAQNHQPETEGNWDDRRRAALQAYYEWMPVRDPALGAPREALFKNYSIGNLLTIAALETRLMARTEQLEYNDIVPTLKSPEDVENFRSNILWDASREMLGHTQLDFIENTLRESVDANQPWRVIANQIIMASVTAPDLSPHVTEEDIVELEKQWDQARSFVEFSKLGLPTNLDAWDGYPAARERFYDIVKKSNAQGLLVVTGDTHTWWANDLKSQDGTHMGVELGVNSVTSPSPYRKEFLGGKGADYALLTAKDNNSVRYLSGDNHGFIDLEIQKDTAKATFVAVDTIESTSYNAFEKVSFTIKKSGDKARFSGTSGLTFKERFLF